VTNSIVSPDGESHFKMDPVECPNCHHHLLMDRMTQHIPYDEHGVIVYTVGVVIDMEAGGFDLALGEMRSKGELEEAQRKMVEMLHDLEGRT
jgi:hypothetical protein